MTGPVDCYADWAIQRCTRCWSAVSLITSHAISRYGVELSYGGIRYIGDETGRIDLSNLIISAIGNVNIPRLVYCNTFGIVQRRVDGRARPIANRV